MKQFEQLILYEDPGSDCYLVASYHLQTSKKDILQHTRMMASEQTTGTWVTVPGETREILLRHQGKVLNIWQIPDEDIGYGTELTDKRDYIIQIAYPWENFGGQIPMILTTVFGNISMLGRIKLLDLAFPKDLVDQLPGPRFGIQGVRELLQVPERPLLNNMIKPSTGITPEQGAELLYQAAIGGADIIKDDEVLGDTNLSPVLRRVERYMQKLRQAEEETGERKLYCVNVTDEPDRCIKKAEQAVANGARAIMVNYLPTGIAILSSLARNNNINVPILAHLDFGGALYASPYHGISSTLLYGKLARLAGADLLCIPSPYGKFGLAYEKYIRIVNGLRSPLHNKRGTFPIVGGAIKQGHIPKLVEDLGTDFVIGAGGAIHAHPMGSSAGAKAFRQAIHLEMSGLNLDEQKKEFPELNAAIELWGLG